MSQDNPSNKNDNPSATAQNSDWLSRQDDLLDAKQAHTSDDSEEKSPSGADQNKPVDAVERPDYVEAGLAQASSSSDKSTCDSEVSTQPPVGKNWLARQDQMLERSSGSSDSSEDEA